MREPSERRCSLRVLTYNGTGTLDVRIPEGMRCEAQRKSAREATQSNSLKKKKKKKSVYHFLSSKEKKTLNKS